MSGASRRRARLGFAGRLLALMLLTLGVAPEAATQSLPRLELGATAETSPAPEAPPGLSDYGEVAATYAMSATLDFTQRELDRFRDRLIATLAAAPTLLEDLDGTLARASPNGRASFFAGLAAFLVFLIAIGRGVAALVSMYVFRPIFVGLQRPSPRGLLEKGPVLAARIATTIAGVAVVVLTAMLVGAGFYPDDVPAAVQAALLAFTGYAVYRVGDTIWRMVLAPYLPAYRVPALTDREALRLYRWTAAVLAVVVLLTWTLYWLASLELRPESLALLTVSAALLQTGMALAAALACRRAITPALVGARNTETASVLRRAAAALWLPALIGYLTLAGAAFVYRAIIGVETGISPPKVLLIVATGTVLLYGVLIYGVERVARRVRRGLPRSAVEAPVERRTATAPPRDPLADGGDADSSDEEGGKPARFAGAPAPAAPAGALRTYEDLARRVASLFVLAAAAWAIAWFWFGDLIFLESSPLELTRGVLGILLVGYIVYHAVRIWMDRRIEEEGGEELDLEPGDEGGGGHAASRIATLLPLVRSFVLAMIAASVAIFAAMEIGVNVAPLVGGAGVVGLAIGFGSQTLVRDILSGAFFLMDDAFRKGEYVDIGEVKGTVERISLRSFQLRHHLGALHTVPFGEVKHLTNYSRDWVIMKLPLRLTYDTDVEKVRKLIKKLGQELLQHPEEGHKFLQPLKSQGVYQMEDSAMIVRVKFMTRPGDQWTTRKLVYQRIRELFEKEGIRFAHREVTVRIPDLPNRPLTEEERRAAGAAARRAVDDAEEAARLLPVAVGDDR